MSSLDNVIPSSANLMSIKFLPRRHVAGVADHMRICPGIEDVGGIVHVLADQASVFGDLTMIVSTIFLIQLFGRRDSSG